jgi:hypothetical protein
MMCALRRVSHWLRQITSAATLPINLLTGQQTHLVHCSFSSDGLAEKPQPKETEDTCGNRCHQDCHF